MFGLSAVQQALFVYSELRNTGVFPPLVSQNEIIHKRCIHLVARDYDVEVSIVPSVVCVFADLRSLESVVGLCIDKPFFLAELQYLNAVLLGIIQWARMCVVLWVYTCVSVSDPFNR